MTTAGLVVTACVIALVVWEIVAFVAGRKRALLSTWFQKFGFRSPAAILGLGMLMGHFWMYFPPTVDDEPVQCPCCKSQLILNVDAETGDLTADLKKTSEEKNHNSVSN